MSTWQDRSLNINDISFSDNQYTFLREFITKFSQKTKKSKIFAQKYRSVLADSKAASGFRLSMKEIFYPLVGSYSYGAMMKDIDGNDYIDITMGYGSNLLGNNPDFITNSLSNEATAGLALGTRSKEVGRVSELITMITGHDRVAFCNSGTEAVMAAIRLARAQSKKNLIAIFVGSYHGHSDLTHFKISQSESLKNAVPSLGVPSDMLNNLLILEYGSTESLQEIDKYANVLAAVLVEPVQAKNPSFYPSEFLIALRELTKKRGIALIFDEMITGFRAHPAGIQGLLGFKADIATYGKIVGGGLPMGVVAGKAIYLDYIDGGHWRYEDDSYPPSARIFFAGTYSQHPLVLAASKTLLEYIYTSGEELQANLNQMTSDFCEEMNTFFITECVPIKFVYFSSMFRLQIPSFLDIFYYMLMYKGIYICEWRNCFFSTAHSEKDVRKIINIIKESVYELKSSKFIENKVIEDSK